MWVTVLFDLPVKTRKQSKAATKFRNFLIDSGFWMKQFSVYMKYYENREKAEVAARHIGGAVPEKGSVTILFITDKQFGKAQNFYGSKGVDNDKKPDQLALF